MTHPITFLRNHPKTFTTIILLVLAVMAGIIFRLITPPAPQNQIPYQASIFPGTSSTSDVIEVLGQPLKQTAWNDQTILNYKATGSNWNHQFFTENNKVVLIRELITTDSQGQKTALFERHGPPEATLYGPLSTAGQHLYLYLSQGLGVIAPEFADGINEVWYFAPTTLDRFLNEIAVEHGYSDQKPPEEIE